MSVTKEDVDSAKAYVKNFKALPAEERKQITEPFLQRLINHGIIQDTNYYKKYFDDILFEDREKFESEYKNALTYEPNEIAELYTHIAAYIYPRLKEYREWCAEHLYQSEDQREDYVKKLDKMIVAFKIILARELGDPTQYVWDKEIADKKIEKGLKLFAKNFESFWT